MKHLLFAAALAIAPMAAVASPTTPGPERLAAPFALAGDTHSFVRCYYQIDEDARKPATSFRWAKDAMGRDFRLPGRWLRPGGLTPARLLATQTRQASIAAMCNETLRREALGRPLAMMAVADNMFSLDYRAWTIDTPAEALTPTRLITFGDSLSDSHNMYTLSLRAFPNATTWFNGSFSNGPTWAKTAAELTGLEWSNWAIGGAAADQFIIVPGLVQQVREWVGYRQSLPNYRHERSIYTVLVGANDLAIYGRSPAASLATQAQAVEMLIADGAKNIVLLNLPDITRAPMFLLRHDAATMAMHVHAFNAGLSAMRASLQATHGSRVHIELFDTNAAFARILENPAAHGLDNVTDACVAVRSVSPLTFVTRHPIDSACTDADRYMFWDLLHPTRRGHQVLGEIAAQFIAEKFL